MVLREFLEELGLKSVENRIHTYSKILLLYLIRQTIEKRTTKSWDTAIRIAIREINYSNERYDKSRTYLNLDELQDAIVSALDVAVNLASFEVEEGKYDYLEIKQMIDCQALVNRPKGSVAATKCHAALETFAM